MGEAGHDLIILPGLPFCLNKPFLIGSHDAVYFIAGIRKKRLPAGHNTSVHIAI